MSRPTPVFIFSSTAAVIALMLGLLSSVSATPAAARAGGAPEVYLAPVTAPVTTETQPAQEQPQPRPEPAPPQPTAQPELAAVVPEVAPVFTAEPQPEGDLGAFIQAVADGSGGLVGVFAPGRFGLPVVRQPGGDPIWVSTNERDVTLFEAPLEYGVTALLAHNNLAGRDFTALPDGQELVLVYGDGSSQAYRIIGRESYQAVEPLNTAGDLVNLGSGEWLTSGEVFARLYTGAYPLVLQTCIEQNGDYFWGRLFLLAQPVN